MALTAAKPEFWAAAAQTLYIPYAVHKQVAQIVDGEVERGRVLHRPAKALNYIQPITPGADLDAQSINVTDQFLTVDQYDGGLMQIYEFDKMQSNLNLMKEFGEDMSRTLWANVDSKYLYEAVNAASTVDDATIGGTAGNPAAVTASTVMEIITKAKQKIYDTTYSYDNLFCACDSGFAQILEQYNTGRETPYGDELVRNGYVGRIFQFSGVDFYVTGNYTRSKVVGIATNPTDGDTMTLTLSVPGGSVSQVITFVSSIGTTAGNVLIGSDADATRVNLETLLNAPGTTTATGVAFTAGAVLRTFQLSLFAENDATANTITLYAKGRDLTIEETFSAGADGEVTALTGNRLMFGRKERCASIATQIRPDVLLREEPKQDTMNVIYETSFGIKTFTDNAQNMVQLFTQSS